MRTILLGDVHGCLDELRDLFSLLALTRDDVLVSLGDLLDKGPCSAEVVQHLRDLRYTGYNVVLVEGNHEEKHRRVRRALLHDPKNVASFRNAEELLRVNSRLSPDDVAFLETAVLFHAIPEHRAVVVHGGFLPDMQPTGGDLPTSSQLQAMPRPEREKWMRALRVRHVTGADRVTVTIEFEVDPEAEGAAMGKLRCAGEDWFAEPGDAIAEIAMGPLLAARHGTPNRGAVFVKRTVRSKGSMVALGEETEADPFWAEVYDGRFGHVFYGHTPYADRATPMKWTHATGIDLGCVHGGRLCAAVLEVDRSPVYVSVPARQKYATSFYDE
jgi:hypothetical protein